MDVPVNIRGADDLVNWFGGWPTFHDAEVLSIAFNRSSGCRVVVHAGKKSPGANSDAQHFMEYAVVTFDLEGFPTDHEGIVNTRLEYFNHQNVLSEAFIEESPEGNALVLRGIHGVSGRIYCERVSVTIRASTSDGAMELQG